MTYDVFISYSKVDQKIVKDLTAYLEQNEVRCFVAYRDIPSGLVWAKAITQAIEKSKLMVVVFSENFDRSEQVDREIEICIEERKPVITFRIEEAAFTGAKKYYLKNLNWIDAFPNPEKCFRELLDSIILHYHSLEKKNDKLFECILVPSYFNILKRQEVIDSHEQNGEKCDFLLSQTNAIALALYAHKVIESLLVAIIIYESSSIEVSILDIRYGIFEVKSTGGVSYEASNDSNLVSKVCIETLRKAELIDNIGELVIASAYLLDPLRLITIETIFGKAARKLYNLSDILTKGQDIFIGINSGVFKHIHLLDVLPVSIGIETLGGLMTKLISANTSIPYEKKEIFSTAEDNQPSVEIHILQGEQPFAKDNLSIGRFHFDGILPALRGVPRIEVIFKIDIRGILTVSAKDLLSGKEVEVIF